jgi:hypothetical protein
MSKRVFSLIAISAAAAVTCVGHSASEEQALESQLQAIYRASTINVANGQILDRGSVLIIHKPGFAANPSNTAAFINIVKGGQVKHHKGSEFLAKMSSDTAPPVNVQVGDGFFITKLQVKKDEVTFHIRSCGACEPGAALDPNYVSAVITFQFDKGTLLSAQAADVHAAIAPFITTLEEEQGAAPAPQQGAVTQAPARAGAENGGGPPPVNITQGEDVQQVMNALGPPLSNATVGQKQVLTYSNLKITFLNGKVLDVQ